MSVPEWALNLSSVFLDEIYPFYQMIYHNRTEAKRLISGRKQLHFTLHTTLTFRVGQLNNYLLSLSSQFGLINFLLL